jgi:hypothetical protein
MFLGGDTDIAELRKKLKGVTDPRRPWGNLRHKPEDILVIGLAALLYNGSDFEAQIVKRKKFFERFTNSSPRLCRGYLTFLDIYTLFFRYPGNSI